MISEENVNECDIDEDEYRINQGEMENSKFKNIRKIYDACKGVVKIMTSKKLGSGFFIKLEKGNSPFYCLMSNEHIISKDIIEKKEKIEVFYDNQSKTINIILNKNERFIQDYRFLNIDSTVVEIIPKDNILKDFFLLPNIEYKNGYDQFINKSIYVPQFPAGGDLNISDGIIKSINLNKYELIHLASTLRGSSGSPIFLNDSTKVLGIHKQTNDKKKENYGNFLEPIIESLKLDLAIIIKKYDNGIYEGGFKDNMKEGLGKFIFKNEEYFIGQFERDKFNGKGIIFYKNNKIKFEGEFKKGLKYGKGKEYYPNNKIKYDGNFVNDNYNGEGKLIERNGYSYIGQWIDGKKNGRGVLYYKENILYEGDFIDDKYDGNGKFFYDNGDYYIGPFKKCLKNGYGIIYYKNNNKKYEGDFVNDKIEGEGVFHWESGDYFIGNFKNGKREGYGIEYDKNNNIKYEGNFKDDLYNGKIILNYNKGNILIGDIKEGKMNTNYAVLSGNDKEYILRKKDDSSKQLVISEDNKITSIDFKNISENQFISKCKIKEKGNNIEENKNYIISYKEISKKEEENKNDNIVSFEKEYDKKSILKINFHSADGEGDIVYEGEVNNITGLPDGKGKKIFLDGNIYIGEFKNGDREGKGKIVDKNKKLIYEGDFVKNQFEGKGKYFYNNNFYYIGDFKNGKIEGKGKLFYTDSNKIIYEGDFIDGLFEGEGTYYYNQDYTIVGNFKNGEPEGEGILYGKNNEIIFHGIFDDLVLLKILPKIAFNKIKNIFRFK